MDEKKREEIANFRYGLIAPLVSRKLEPGEQKRLLEETADHWWKTPDGNVRRVGLRTLERWLAAYRAGGLLALKPAVRKGTCRKLDPEVLKAAVALREEMPSRSVRQIIDILELSGQTPRGSVRPTTLARHLRRLGKTRDRLLTPRDTFKRRTVRRPLEEVQGDVCELLYLPDQDRPGKKRKTYLVLFLDACTRVVLAAQIYFQARMPMQEDCLKKAVLRYGIPEKLYVDNASVYTSHHLKRICGRLGIHLVHSRPYRPQGRGLVERLFGYVQTSFVPEAYALIQAGKLTYLEELNDAFAAWLEVAYHHKKHATLKTSPRAFWARQEFEARRVDLDTLHEVFLWEETRRVDVTGCFSLQGNLYEVAPHLARSRVTVRFDPYDLRTVQVWHENKREADAVPVSVSRRKDSRVPIPDAFPESKTGLNYVELLQKQYAADRTKQLSGLVFPRGGKRK